jgi:hypothetical protein
MQLVRAATARELSGKNSAIFETLERNAPQLNDAEVQKIADKVARVLIERDLNRLPPEKRATQQERVRKLAYDISIGLASSGIWAALVYAGSRMSWFAGPEKTEYQIKQDRRMMLIRAKLAEGLSKEQADDLDFITFALTSRIAATKQLAERLLRMEDFQQFLAEVEQEDVRWGVNRFEERDDVKSFMASEFLSAVIGLMRHSVQEQIVPSID